MRGWSSRTGRDSVISGVRTTIISPRTPRRSGRLSRAAKPAAVDDRAARQRCRPRPRSGSRRPHAARRVASAASASRGSRWASSGEEQPLPEPAGEIGLERRDRRRHRPKRNRLVRRAKRASSARIAGRGHDQRAVPHRAGQHAGGHQSSAVRPRSTTACSALSRSHQGASMPPANQEQRPRRCARRARRP